MNPASSVRKSQLGIRSASQQQMCSSKFITSAFTQSAQHVTFCKKTRFGHSRDYGTTNFIIQRRGKKRGIKLTLCEISLWSFHCVLLRVNKYIIFHQRRL